MSADGNFGKTNERGDEMKPLKKILAGLLCAVCVLALAACGGNDTMKGAWRTISAEAEGGYEGARVNLDLKSFGKFEMELVYTSNADDNLYLTGKWKMKGDDVQLNAKTMAQGSAEPTEVEDKETVLTASGEELVYADGKLTATLENVDREDPDAEVEEEDEDAGFLKKLAKKVAKWLDI